MIRILSNVTPGSGFLMRTLCKMTGEEVILPEGYNTWIQSLANPSEELLASSAIFLILDGAELLGRNLTLENWHERLEMPLAAIDNFKQRYPSAPLFVSSIDLPQRELSAMIDGRAEMEIMSHWRSSLAKLRIPIIELAEIAANIGRDNFYNPKMWYFGSIPFSMTGEKALAAECLRCHKGAKGQRKKCLVLDLDNTLWGGVIGEDGTEGIILGANREGSAYRDFQARIKDLKNQGVMLAIVSKNNEEDALAPIRNHPEMQLRENDFVAIKANWLPKAENMAALANELNIGLDSFVFIDDNPVERESVRMQYPEVEIPEFPEDPSKLENFMRNVAAQFFPVLKTTVEDLQKAEQYQAEKRRESEKVKFGNLEDYLASLNMRLVIRDLDEESRSRASQLTQKTNQFNLTTRRYTESEIAEMAASPNWRIWIGELDDRFGNYGKIILCIANINGDTAVIDTFLMSCRVMGRNVENAFLDYVESQLKVLGVKEIGAEYRRTAKNSMTEKFWNNMGYIETGSNADGRQYIKKEFPDNCVIPGIKVEEH